MKLFVDYVLVDRLGTLGAPDRIDHELVLQFVEAHQVSDHALHDAELRLGSNPTGDAHDSRADNYVHIIRIERELSLELITHEGAKLVVCEVVAIADVLVVLFHASSGPRSRRSSGSGYRKNRSDAPSVKARLFFQNVLD